MDIKGNFKKVFFWKLNLFTILLVLLFNLLLKCNIFSVYLNLLDLLFDFVVKIDNFQLN